MQIKSANLKTSSVITARSKSSEDRFIRSVSILQSDGSFVVSYPFKNEVVWYPQSPNNPTASTMQSIKTISNLTNYGSLYFPLDAKIDYIRKNLYIVDTGNSRVIKMDLNTQSVVYNFENITIPTAIAINLNTDDVFIRCIVDATTESILYYKNNVLEDSFEFDSNTIYPLTVDGNFVKNIPNTSSMVFDNLRNRLWWIPRVIRNVFMFDLSNNNIVTYDLFNDGYTSLESIDIDATSGNAFIAGVNAIGSMIAQMSKDNTVFLGSGYVPEPS